MIKDIRDQPFLNHEAIVNLNFIRHPGVYRFRRHYRFGLRSHIMEVLRPEDAHREKTGIFVDGLKWFPRAKPLKMLRIFRTRFKGLDQALAELERVKITVQRLTPAHVAVSNEFLVSYGSVDCHDIILCGLQDYIDGEMLDPWGPLNSDTLISLLNEMGVNPGTNADSSVLNWLSRVRQQGMSFIEKIKKMIHEERHIPDLAGVGNLLVTPGGDIKLVDINNISRVYFDPVVRLDDRGYPVCDKSIEALSLLEEKLIGRAIDRGDIIYRTYLNEQRMNRVRNIEQAFHH